MNMKRGLVFSLCALALAAYGSLAHAQTVGVSLNLHYNDPANPSEGGTFQLVAKVNTPGTTKGLSAVNAYISGVNTAGLAYCAGINALTNGGSNVFATPVTGGVNILYGQDTSVAAGTVILNVGSTVALQATDPLRNAAWNNSSVLVTGTFGAVRPAFITVGANSTDSNLFTNTATASTPEPAGAVVDASTNTPVVRGDSMTTLGLNSNPAAGLFPGDSDRNGDVDISDFGALSAHWFDAPVAATTPGLWEKGDFDNNGDIDISDFGALSASWNLGIAPAPISAVPEPTSIVMLGMALLALGGRAVRR